MGAERVRSCRPPSIRTIVTWSAIAPSRPRHPTDPVARENRFNDLDDLVRACLHHDSNIQEFDDSCFSGRYVTGDVTPSYLARLQEERSDEAKVRRKQLHRGSLKAIRAV